MKILLISGAPASGKDTAVLTIQAWHPVLEEKFALPLRKAMRGLLDVNDSTLEWLKREDPRVRQMMIGMSERLIKPTYGQDWFGLACADRVQREWSKAQGKLDVVISDAGFDYEILAFCERVREFEPQAQFQLWNLVRPFCTYDGDSRSEVTLPSRFGEVRVVRNFYSLPEYVEQVREYAKGFFDGL
jgi:hypothetical protein